jgi:hypothetical protein
MGLTPLSGLPGATRSGSVDPGLIFHYTDEARGVSDEHEGGNEGLRITEVCWLEFDCFKKALTDGLCMQRRRRY